MKYISQNPGLGMVAVVMITVFAGFFTESIIKSQSVLVEMMADG